MNAASPDICVVGGGIIGLATACELAGRGLRVTVFEAASIGERAAAGVAAGMIGPVSEVDMSHPDLTRFALASHRDYPAWIEQIEAVSHIRTGFDRTGTLWVAVHRDHVAWLEHLRAFQIDRGLNTIRLTAGEVRAREPLIAPNTSGGLLASDDWQVDPRRLLGALIEVLARYHGTLLQQVSVERVERCDEGWAVIAGGERGRTRIEARSVLLAPGAYGAGLLEPLLRDTGLRPVKGQVVRLRGEIDVHHVIRTPDVYLVPRTDGEVVIGATVEEMGFDGRVTAGAVHDLLREARRALPGIAELELVEVRAGFRPALRDHLPAVGRIDEGLFIAVGHYRNGVALAPITARLLADLICEGVADQILAPFNPLRFAQPLVANAVPT